MKLQFHGPDGAVCEVLEEGVVLSTEQDAVDLIAESGFKQLLLSRAQVHPDFFDLSTRIAGGILQKCVNYNVALAVWGDFSGGSDSLRDFIRESNRGGHCFFLPTRAETLEALLAE